MIVPLALTWQQHRQQGAAAHGMLQVAIAAMSAFFPAFLRLVAMA
jgi:hypothetical protein